MNEIAWRWAWPDMNAELQVGRQVSEMFGHYRQSQGGVASENGKNRTLSVRRCWNPAIQRRNGHAEVLGNVLGWHTAGQQLLG
ncbi:Uncharacterised protein [Klebsiella pneumoniae]|nr:Uncharacterised protein [Klebsiella pneumoniae]